MIQDIVRQKRMAFQFPSARCLHFRTSIGKGEVFNSNSNYEYFLSIFRMGMRWPHHLLQQTRWTKSTICCVNAQNLSECSNRCCSAWRERWKVGQNDFLLHSFVIILLIRLKHLWKITHFYNISMPFYTGTPLLGVKSITIIAVLEHFNREKCDTVNVLIFLDELCWYLTNLFHRFIVDVSATKDREFITINCNSRSTSEVSLLFKSAMT